jgi:hypothetical protein
MDMGHPVLDYRMSTSQSPPWPHARGCPTSTSGLLRPYGRRSALISGVGATHLHQSRRGDYALEFLVIPAIP